MPQPARMPDFLIIGAMKSGTTTLYRDLLASPEVFFPTRKEPNNLCDDAVLTDAGREEYAALFRGATDEQRMGEASTAYTKLPTYPGVPGRAKKLLPDTARFIYVVREPISRILSHHFHEFSWERMPNGIGEALDAHPELTAYSKYAMQVEPWLETFGRERLMVMQFEDFVRDRRESATRLSEFLGLAPFADRIDLEAVHNRGERRALHKGVLTTINQSTAYRRVLRNLIPDGLRQWCYRTWFPKGPEKPKGPTPDLLDRMIEAVAPDCERLKDLLGPDAPSWDFDAVRRKYSAQAEAGEAKAS